MKNDTPFECGTCHIEKPKRDTKKINKKIICNLCIKKRRDKHKEFIKRDILGIRKRKDLLKEWKQKRKEKEEQIPPKIKGSNIEKLRSDIIKRLSRKGSWYAFGYLTKVEKLVLYKKYVSQGMNPETASIKIKRDVKYLSEFVEKLRNKKKSDEEIGKKFKEEFAKLIASD